MVFYVITDVYVEFTTKISPTYIPESAKQHFHTFHQEDILLACSKNGYSVYTAVNLLFITPGLPLKTKSKQFLSGIENNSHAHNTNTKLTNHRSNLKRQQCSSCCKSERSKQVLSQLCIRDTATYCWCVLPVLEKLHGSFCLNANCTCCCSVIAPTYHETWHRLQFAEVYTTCIQPMMYCVWWMEM